MLAHQLKTFHLYKIRWTTYKRDNIWWVYAQNRYFCLVSDKKKSCKVRLMTSTSSTVCLMENMEKIVWWMTDWRDIVWLVTYTYIQQNYVSSVFLTLQTVSSMCVNYQTMFSVYCHSADYRFSMCHLPAIELMCFWEHHTSIYNSSLCITH